MKSMSGHFSPRTSLRRMPVIAVSQSSGNSRCPAAVRRSWRSSSSVNDTPSVRCSERCLGARATTATLRVTSPRRSASVSAPRMSRWISYTVLGASPVPWWGAGACRRGPRSAGTAAVGCSIRAEGREDVALHVAFVAAVGARREVQLLGRQPLAGEVGAEGQRPHRVDPAVSAAASVAARRSASARSVPAGCQLRRSLPLVAGDPRCRDPSGDRGQAQRSRAWPWTTGG